MCNTQHTALKLHCCMVHILPLALSRQIARGRLTGVPTMHLCIPSAPLQSRSRQASLPFLISLSLFCDGLCSGSIQHTRVPPSLKPVCTMLMAVGKKDNHQDGTNFCDAGRDINTHKQAHAQIHRQTDTHTTPITETD